MSVAKVIEITASSTKSFEDAIQSGLNRAADTIEDIKSAWIKDQEVHVEGGKIKEYRVNLKVTFLLR